MFDDLLETLSFASSREIKDAYSTDASIFRVIPEGVVYPKSSMDIMQLVRANNQLPNPHSLTVRAAGTCMSGGPLNEGIIIDVTKHLNSMSQVDRHHKTITVESGAMFRDIEKALTLQNLMFPSYTSSKDICSIGGMIGNNSSGELSVRYGATIDWVESIDVVLSDGNLYTFGELDADAWKAKQSLAGFEGEIYKKIANILETQEDVIAVHTPHVPKNAAGYQVAKICNTKKNTYNLARLFVGAQGTLGIITSATLRLTELPHHRRLVVVALQDVSKVGSILSALHALSPESIETFDIHTYELAKIYHTEDAVRIAYVSEGAPLTFFVQVSEETDVATEEKQKEVMRVFESFELTPHIPHNTATQESFFIIRRASFKMLMEHARGSVRVAPCIEDTIVPIEKYGVFLQLLQNILQKYPFTYTYAGHIGDGSIRLLPLVDFARPHVEQEIRELAESVYDLVISLGGSISVDHNDGLARTYYLEKQYGREYVMMLQDIKQFFDSKNIFNPGKKVTTTTIGTREYAYTHIKK